MPSGQEDKLSRYLKNTWKEWANIRFPEHRTPNDTDFYRIYSEMIKNKKVRDIEKEYGQKRVTEDTPTRERETNRIYRWIKNQGNRKYGADPIRSGKLRWTDTNVTEILV